MCMYTVHDSLAGFERTTRTQPANQQHRCTIDTKKSESVRNATPGHQTHPTSNGREESDEARCTQDKTSQQTDLFRARKHVLAGPHLVAGNLRIS